jgi:hypothetical protein
LSIFTQIKRPRTSTNSSFGITIIEAGFDEVVTGGFEGIGVMSLRLLSVASIENLEKGVDRVRRFIVVFKNEISNLFFFQNLIDAVIFRNLSRPFS